MLKLILCLGLLSGTHSLPSFKWLNDRSSEAGVPLLAIDFGDNDVDFVSLEPFNPIPLVADERQEDVDACIFKGHLMNEPDVAVAMTGGCPHATSFEILITSKRLKSHMLKVENGNVIELESPFTTSTVDFLHSPEHLFEDKLALDRLSLPPNGMSLNVGVQYDQLFKNQFGGDSVNTVRRVMANVVQIYNLPSLGTKLNINIIFISELSTSITGGASGSNLNSLQQFAKSTVNSNVFMTFKNNQPGVVGTSYLGVVCDPRYQLRANVNNWHRSDLTTGLIVAHEIGHNLGMSHDFIGSPGTPRFDSNGITCTNIGGVMDYNQYSVVWSRCSIEDFTRYFNQNQPFCLLPVGGNTGSQDPCVKLGGSKGCVSKCAKVDDPSKYTCNFEVSSVKYSCSCLVFRQDRQSEIEKLPQINSTSVVLSPESDVVISKVADF